MLLTLSKASFIVFSIILFMSEGSARRGGGRGCAKEWFSKTARSISNKNSKERLFILNAFLLTYVNECLNLLLEEIMTTIIFYHQRELII